MDSITFKINADRFHQAIGDRQRRMPHAARWAVREAGRVAKREARKRAPVLKDRTVTAAAVARGARFRKAGNIGPIPSSTNGPVAGLLRASIAPSKRLKQVGDSEFSLKVGPRGLRVHLYAQKEERRAGYMAAGEAAARAQVGRIAQEAFDRVWRE